MKIRTRALQRFRNRLTPLQRFCLACMDSIKKNMDEDAESFCKGDIDFQNPPKDTSEFKISVQLNPNRYKPYNIS